MSQTNEKIAFGIEEKEQVRFKKFWQNLLMPFKNIFNNFR